MLQPIPATVLLIDSFVRDLLLPQASEVPQGLTIQLHGYDQDQSNADKLPHAHHLMKGVSAGVTFQVNQNEKFDPPVLVPDLLSNDHVSDFQLLADAE